MKVGINGRDDEMSRKTKYEEKKMRVKYKRGLGALMQRGLH